MRDLCTRIRVRYLLAQRRIAQWDAGGRSSSFRAKQNQKKQVRSSLGIDALSLQHHGGLKVRS